MERKDRCDYMHEPIRKLLKSLLEEIKAKMAKISE